MNDTNDNEQGSENMPEGPMVGSGPRAAADAIARAMDTESGGSTDAKRPEYGRLGGSAGFEDEMDSASDMDEEWTEGDPGDENDAGMAGTPSAQETSAGIGGSSTLTQNT